MAVGRGYQVYKFSHGLVLAMYWYTLRFCRWGFLICFYMHCLVGLVLFGTRSGMWITDNERETLL